MTPKSLHRRRHRKQSHARHNQHNHDPRANCGCCDDCQSLPSSTTTTGWFQGIQAWMRGGGSSPKGQGGPRPPQVVSSSSASQFHQDRPVACRLYIWNFPSAILHKWCHHLAKDCINEGMGGVKFVRVAPGSMLQLLWPCSSYSPDACLWCGGNFQDHLTLNWYPHLYSPLDQYLDQTLQQATSHLDLAQQSNVLSSDIPTLLFHRNYVRDGLEIVSRDETPRTKKARRRKKRIQRLLQE